MAGDPIRRRRGAGATLLLAACLSASFLPLGNGAAQSPQANEWRRTYGDWNGLLPETSIKGANFFETVGLTRVGTPFSLERLAGTKLKARPIRQMTLPFSGIRVDGRPVRTEAYMAVLCGIDNSSCDSSEKGADAIVLATIPGHESLQKTYYLYYYDRLERSRYYCGFSANFIEDVMGSGRRWRCHDAPYGTDREPQLPIGGRTIDEVLHLLQTNYFSGSPNSIALRVADVFKPLTPGNDVEPHTVRCTINPRRPDC